MKLIILRLIEKKISLPIKSKALVLNSNLTFHERQTSAFRATATKELRRKVTLMACILLLVQGHFSTAPSSPPWLSLLWHSDSAHCAPYGFICGAN